MRMLIRRYLHKGRHHHTPDRLSVARTLDLLTRRDFHSWIEAMT